MITVPLPQSIQRDRDKLTDHELYARTAGYLSKHYPDYEIVKIEWTKVICKNNNTLFD